MSSIYEEKVYISAMDLNDLADLEEDMETQRVCLLSKLETGKTLPVETIRYIQGQLDVLRYVIEFPTRLKNKRIAEEAAHKEPENA